MSTSLLLALLAPSAHADWPAGAEIWPAMYVDITREGLASAEDIARTVLPPTFPIDSSSIAGGGGADLLIIDAEYSFGVDNLFITPTLLDLTINPVAGVPHEFCPSVLEPGALELTMVMDIGINSAADPAVLHFDASVGFLGLFDWDVIDEDCAMHVDNARTTVTAKVRMGPKMQTIPGQCPTPQLDATGHVMLDIQVEDIGYTLPPLGQEDLNLRSAPGGSCIIDDIVEIADDLFGLDVVELVIAEVTPTLDAQIETVLEDLQGTLADTLSVLAIQQSIDLLGTPLNIGLFPNDLIITDEGLRLEMVGSFDTGPSPHPCVSRFDDGLSEQTIPPTDPRYPFVGQTPAGIPRGIGALLNDDWLGQAAYAAWRGGLLCFEISDGNSPVDLPIPINTTLLTILAPGAFTELFPTAAPLVLRTRPEKEPTLKVNDPALTHDLEVDIETLGLDFMGEIDGRLSRIAGLDLDAALGVDVTFDGTTGLLGAAVDFDPSTIVATVSFNDLNAAANSQIESNFSTLAEQLVGPLLGSALSDLTFPLPSFSGLGVTSADVQVTGAQGFTDFLGVYGTVGAVSYGDPAGGCDSTSATEGCGDSGCSNVGPRATTASFALLVLALRRRRR
jgi:hypothetical protein